AARHPALPGARLRSEGNRLHLAMLAVVPTSRSAQSKADYAVGLRLCRPGGRHYGNQSRVVLRKSAIHSTLNESRHRSFEGPAMMSLRRKHRWFGMGFLLAWALSHSAVVNAQNEPARAAPADRIRRSLDQVVSFDYQGNSFGEAIAHM